MRSCPPIKDPVYRRFRLFAPVAVLAFILAALAGAQSALAAASFVSGSNGQLYFLDGSTSDNKLTITSGPGEAITVEDTGNTMNPSSGCSFVDPEDRHQVRCQHIDRADIQTTSGSDTVVVRARIPADVNAGNQNDVVRTSNVSGDRLFGGYGNDVLDGGRGDDELLGDEGSDTADYAFRINTVVADLAKGTGGVGSEEDVISGIEVLRGGSAGDVLSGDDAGNVIIGNGGDDILVGAGGADWLVGGSGDDLIHSYDPVPGGWVFWSDLVHCGAGRDRTASNSQTFPDWLYDCELPYPSYGTVLPAPVE